MPKFRSLTVLPVVALALGMVFVVVAAARSTPQAANAAPGEIQLGEQPYRPGASSQPGFYRYSYGGGIYTPERRVPVSPPRLPEYVKATGPELAAGWLSLNGETALPTGPSSVFNAAGDWDGLRIRFPRLLWDGTQYRMLYDGTGLGTPGLGSRTGFATSPDGIVWTKYAGNPVIGTGGPGAWDEKFRGLGSSLYEGGVYKWWFSGTNGGLRHIGYATSTDFINWSFLPANPVLRAGNPGEWDEAEVDLPNVINDNGTYKMWYAGCNFRHTTCGIGYATSPDGLNWVKHPDRVLTSGAPGAWDETPVGRPIVIKTGASAYRMYYFSDGKVGFATSTDGISWTKYSGNPVMNEGWDGQWVRGFDIRLEGNLYRAWLASGTGLSTAIGYAESTDGINWSTPVTVLPRGIPGIHLEVNYAHDWALVYTAAGEPVTITLSQAGQQYTVSGLADGTSGWFTSTQAAWNPVRPNFQVGDSAAAQNSALSTGINPVGSIDAVLDLNADTVSGVVNAPWLSPGKVDVYCDVWVDNGPPRVRIFAVSPNGGAFTCNFASVGWDLQPRQDVAVRYIEPDGDAVINVITTPWGRVNYRDDSAGINYPAGHTFTITITNGSGAVKAFAQGQTTPGGGWGGDGYETSQQDWTPKVPDIQPGDWAHFQSSDGYSNDLRVGTVTGNLNAATDSLIGTVQAPWLTGMLDVECQPWGGPWSAPVKQSSAASNGSTTYTCQWDPLTEWDILPGQDVAAMYIEPDGDRVINAFHGPSPRLRVLTGAQGAPGEGGNFSLLIEYQNGGEALAQNVAITSTLSSGLVYLGDTSGRPHTGTGAPGSPLVWQMGDLSPSQYSQRFEVFVQVTGSANSPVSHTAQIGASTFLGGQNPDDLHSTWTGQILPNDTQVGVEKWAWTGDPLPGSDFVYTLNTCNSGGTGSSQLTLTDNLPVTTTLVSWSSQYGGWQEVSRSAQQLVLRRPTIPGGSCAQVELKAHVSPAAAPGTALVNTASIAAANDLDPADNATSTTNHVGLYPHPNLAVWKGWPAYGQTVPGSDVVYELGYENSGNVPVSGASVTLQLPDNTTFARAWTATPAGDVPVTPALVTSQVVRWDLATLPAGYRLGFQVLLHISENAVPGQPLTSTFAITRLPWEDRYDDNQVVNEDWVTGYGPNLRLDKQTYSWRSEAQLWYNLRLINPGTTTLVNFPITDTLPAGTTLNNWWQDHGPPVSGTYQAGSNQLDFLVSELKPGETASLGILIDLQPQLVGVRGLTFTNQVNGPIAGDVYPQDNFDQVIARTSPDVFVRKWLSGGVPIAGTVVTFTVEFGNGNLWPWDTNPQMGSHITETLPAGMTFITNTSPWTPGATWTPESVTATPQGTIIVWSWGPMWSNTTRAFDIAVRMADNVQVGDVLVNHIAAYGDDPQETDYDWSNNEFTLAVTVEKYRKLFLPLVSR